MSSNLDCIKKQLVGSTLENYFYLQNISTIFVRAEPFEESLENSFNKGCVISVEVEPISSKRENEMDLDHLMVRG